MSTSSFAFCITVLLTVLATLLAPSLFEIATLQSGMPAAKDLMSAVISGLAAAAAGYWIFSITVAEKKKSETIRAAKAVQVYVSNTEFQVSNLRQQIIELYKSWEDGLSHMHPMLQMANPFVLAPLAKIPHEVSAVLFDVISTKAFVRLAGLAPRTDAFNAALARIQLEREQILRKHFLGKPIPMLHEGSYERLGPVDLADHEAEQFNEELAALCRFCEIIEEACATIMKEIAPYVWPPHPSATPP